MATTEPLTVNPTYVIYFQERIRRGLEYWYGHEAIRQLKVAILDRERATILTVINLGLDLPPVWPLVKQLIVALTPYMERRGHWEEWHGVLHKAIAAAQQTNDVSGETTLTALLARLSQRMSRPADVVKYYRRTIRLARQAGNRFEEARACSNLGFLYIDGGHWWRAEVLSVHALAIFADLGSAHGQAHTHNHLGVLYTRQGRWEDAEPHLDKACHMWQQQNDGHGLLYGLLNLGLLYNEQGAPQKAIAVLNRAVQVAEISGEQSLLGLILNNLAIAHRLNRDQLAAKQVALEAEKILQKFSLNLELAQIWHNLGLIHEGMGQLSEAKTYLARSRQMYLQLNHEHSVIEIDSEIRRLTLA